MKNLVLAIGALLVISGIVSVNLWRDLRTERLENTHLTTQLAEVSMTPRTPANSAQQVAAPTPAAGVSGSPAATVATPLLVDRGTALQATEASVSAGAVAAARLHQRSTWAEAGFLPVRHTLFDGFCGGTMVERAAALDTSRRCLRRATTSVDHGGDPTSANVRRHTVSAQQLAHLSPSLRAARA